MKRIRQFAVIASFAAMLVACIGDISGQEKAGDKKEPVAGGLIRRNLTMAQRRDLGLTIANISNVVRDLKDAGEIDDESSTSEIAAAVATVIEAKNTDYKGKIDWDAIISFIERLIPLILK